MELTITLFPLNDARFFTKEELNDDDPNNNIEKGIIKDDEFESEEPSVDEVLFENLIGSRIGSGRRMRARRLIFRYLKDSILSEPIRWRSTSKKVAALNFVPHDEGGDLLKIRRRSTYDKAVIYHEGGDLRTDKVTSWAPCRSQKLISDWALSFKQVYI